MMKRGAWLAMKKPFFVYGPVFEEFQHGGNEGTKHQPCKIMKQGMKGALHHAKN
jgi:hypothetical protein